MNRVSLFASLAIVAAGVAYLIYKRGVANAAAGAVGVVADMGAGVVVGVGDVFGVPRTAQTQCDADLAAGRTWDASFSCPAGTWLKSLF